MKPCDSQAEGNALQLAMALLAKQALSIVSKPAKHLAVDMRTKMHDMQLLEQTCALIVPLRCKYFSQTFNISLPSSPETNATHATARTALASFSAAPQGTNNANGS